MNMRTHAHMSVLVPLIVAPHHHCTTCGWLTHRLPFLPLQLNGQRVITRIAAGALERMHSVQALVVSSLGAKGTEWKDKLVLR